MASPIDGVVLVKSANVGEILARRNDGGDDRRHRSPWLRGVHQRDAIWDASSSATKAKITTDSYPGKVYSGRVSFISSEAEFTPKQIQTAEER